MCPSVLYILRLYPRWAVRAHPATLTRWWSERPNREPHETTLASSCCLKAGEEEQKGWFTPKLSPCYETGVSPGHTSEPGRAPEPTSWGSAWGILFLRSWAQTTRSSRWQTDLDWPPGHSIPSPLGPWCIQCQGSSFSYLEPPNLSLPSRRCWPCDRVWVVLMKSLQLYARVCGFPCSICLLLGF